MILTRTHNQSLDETEYVRLKDRWETFVMTEMDVWCRFHRYWILKAKTLKIPLLVLRFEDVVRDKKSNMRRVLRFLYEEAIHSDDSLASCDERLRKLFSGDRSRGAGYKPRSRGGPGKSLVHYDKELCNCIREKIPNISSSLRAFGYENLLMRKRDIRNTVDLDPCVLMELLKITKDTSTREEGESKRHKRMWRRGGKGCLPRRPVIDVNEPSQLIRPKTEEDPTRRGTQWAKELHQSGIRLQGAKEIAPVK